MTDRTRTVKVDWLSRVEGEGGLTITTKGDVATAVRLNLFEPPRFFESLLVGRDYTEAPDFTSRICGICPVAYLMSACQAMEDALGIRVEGGLRDLRRLLYAGEWAESHALHAFMLHAPDFLGYPDAIAMARDHGDWVRKGLRMKKAGNAIITALGGREIHPVNVRVGGFYRVPKRAELLPLLDELTWSRDAAAECLGWMSTLTFPQIDRDYEFVALRHADEYPFCDGRVVSSRGLDIDVRDYEKHFEEYQAPHSNALHSRRVGGGHYLCGPLARFNLNFDRLDPEIQALARAAGLVPPVRNPYRMLLVRLIEIAQAFTEALALVERYTPPPRPFVNAPARAGIGCGATEAPRGMLYHRYELDEKGTIVSAKIVPPTSQNQSSIEDDLAALAPALASLPLADATHLAEQSVRNHDPCISCATHFLTLTIERE
jgi:coenzyme F420-reducing hydrogenase alpha subunit